MIVYYSSDFKSGLKVLIDNHPCEIQRVDFVKPGKGQSFSRVKLKKLLTGQLIERTLRSTDSLLSADIFEIKYTYIYHDNMFWHFIHQSNFEQIAIGKNIIQDKYKWLLKNNSYTIILWNQNPIGVVISHFIDLKVVSFVSDSKKNMSMSKNNFKLCMLNTGLILQVPLFIQIGDIIRIDTRKVEYHSRIHR
ncbi:elongation factor P [Buchnera aphidicola]|uniref:elongation factor P n=1 Tax=Buchnera aphidicola TaxID=9 RepID=UPI0031B85A63